MLASGLKTVNFEAAFSLPSQSNYSEIAFCFESFIVHLANFFLIKGTLIFGCELLLDIWQPEVDGCRVGIRTLRFPA